MSVRRTYSGVEWEKEVGYCRALRTGDRVFVTGTTSVKDGAVFAPGDPYAQTHRCLEIIAEALQALGSNLHDVMRTRIFVTDISQWKEVGRAHGEVFQEHPPTTTLVEVSALIDPAMLVEIEADAVVI